MTTPNGACFWRELPTPRDSPLVAISLAEGLIAHEEILPLALAGEFGFAGTGTSSDRALMRRCWALAPLSRWVKSSATNPLPLSPLMALSCQFRCLKS